MPSKVTPWLRVAFALVTVAWGANHFAGLLAAYRLDGHDEAFISFAVGIYAVGLVGALLCVALLGDRIDHRNPIRLAVVLSALGTVLIAMGSTADELIHLGRFIAGIATGLVLAPGTAWLMHLAAASAPGTGARRATISLTLGFGGGPVVTGLMGEWLPRPDLTPYFPHLVLSVVAAFVVWHAPDAAPARLRRPWTTALQTVRRREFMRTLPLAAPWVFGAVTTAFAVVPGAVEVTTLPVATNALVLALALLGGLAIQGRAKRMEAAAPGRPLIVGMGFAALGCLAAIWAFEAQAQILLFVVAALLGVAYGLLLVGGLSRVEAWSAPEDRTRINAVFYALTYVGFGVPYAFVFLTERWVSPVQVMVGGIVIALGTMALLWVSRPRASAASRA